MQTITALDDHLKTLANIERSGEGGARGPADKLVEVTERIENQTAIIRKDCVPWQIARATVGASIVEATIASRCYHPPSFISAVLSRRQKDPRYIARAVEYLTHVIHYVSEHQPDDYASIEKAEDGLDKLAHVVKETISSRVMDSLGALPARKGKGGGASDIVFPVAQKVQQPSAYLNTPRGNQSIGFMTPREGTSLGMTGTLSSTTMGRQAIFSNVAALEGIGELSKKAYIAFEEASEEQFAVDIPNLILAKMRSILDPLFDARYGEEFESWVIEAQAQGRLSRSDLSLTASYIARHIDEVTSTELFDIDQNTRNTKGRGSSKRSAAAGGVAPGHRKHYRRGTHGLLSISELSRILVLEVSEVLEKFLIVPLEDHLCVVDLPSRVACAVFRGIMKHARHAMFVSPQLLEADPTIVFIATGGAGPGLASIHECRFVRDAIFIGLDLFEELWQWKNHVAPNLRGTHDEFDDLVQQEMQAYSDEILALLTHYRNSKGTIDGKQLILDDKIRASGKATGLTEGLGGYTAESGSIVHGRRSWFPSPDCSTHECTINFIYMMRTLFVDYFGSLKLVLSGGDVMSSDPETALEEVCEFATECVEKHITDMITIAETASTLQRMDSANVKVDAAKLESNARKLAKSVLGKGVVGTAPSGMGKRDVHISPPIFVLNNIYYLSQNLQQTYFTRRTRIVTREVEVTKQARAIGASGADAMSTAALWPKFLEKQKANAPQKRKPAREESEAEDEEYEEAEEEEEYEEDIDEDEDDEDAPPPTSAAPTSSALSVHKKRHRVKVPLLEDLVVTVQGMVTPWVRTYRAHWRNVFPSFTDQEYAPAGAYSLYQASQGSSAPLTTQQKETIKLYCQLLCGKLLESVGDGMVHIAADPLIKATLIDQAASEVREGFRRLDADLIKGRQWSVNPNKYLGRNAEEWEAAVRGIL